MKLDPRYVAWTCANCGSIVTVPVGAPRPREHQSRLPPRPHRSAAFRRYFSGIEMLARKPLGSFEAQPMMSPKEAKTDWNMRAKSMPEAPPPVWISPAERQE